MKARISRQPGDPARIAAVIAGAAAVLGIMPGALAQQGAGSSAPDAASAEGVNAPTVSAVWMEREFSFTYMGIGTYYSCDGLRNKLEYLLEQVGARKDPKVIVSCLDAGAVEQLPMARIRVAVPVEATPERLAELASGQSHRELVGRVQGKGTAVDDATAQFPAERRVVEFDGRRGRRVEDSDCELLNQFLPQVLKPLGVREMPGSTLRCTPKQSQFGAVNLRLETLQAVREPKQADAATR
jgi:hypothetical protein